jgi:hypothetical protein
VLLLHGQWALCASVSQSAFQSTVGKIQESQAATDQKIHALQGRFEDFLRTNQSTGSNAGLTSAQVTLLAQNAAETYLRTLDLGSKIDNATDSAARGSLLGVSNLVCRLETNLLTTIRGILATNVSHLSGASALALTNSSEKNAGQLLTGLQVISAQLQAIQVNGLSFQTQAARSARQSLYTILAGDVFLLVAALATAYFIWSHNAAATNGINANLERNVHWFGSSVQCVATAVSENLTTQRAEMAEHLRSLKTQCESAMESHGRTLGRLNENTMAQLGEVNVRLDNAGAEITAALRLSADALSGNRLEAELNQATMLWKKSFGHTLVEEQTRGQNCLRQLRDDADGQLGKILIHEREKTDAVARECVEHVQHQFRQSLETELDSARRTWAQHLEQERQVLATDLERFVRRQTDVLKQRFEEMDHNLGVELERLKQRDEAFGNLLWPALFRHGLLKDWRDNIIQGAIRHDPVAVELMLALGRYNNVGRNGADLRKMAEALHAVSLGAYQFWKKGDGKVLDASQEWKTAFQSALDAANTPLDIMLVLEGERFDMNTMLAADNGSASRIVVRDVLSWIVRDKSNQPAKVLCHGRVTTG